MVPPGLGPRGVTACGMYMNAKGSVVGSSNRVRRRVHCFASFNRAVAVQLGIRRGRGMRLVVMKPYTVSRPPFIALISMRASQTSLSWAISRNSAPTPPVESMIRGAHITQCTCHCSHAGYAPIAGKTMSKTIARPEEAVHSTSRVPACLRTRQGNSRPETEHTRPSHVPRPERRGSLTTNLASGELRAGERTCLDCLSPP